MCKSSNNRCSDFKKQRLLYCFNYQIFVSFLFFKIKDGFLGDIALDEEDFGDFKDHAYLEEKMGTSIHELQIEDPSTMTGSQKGPYTQYDDYTGKEKGNEKEIAKDTEDLNKKKKSRRKCAKG